MRPDHALDPLAEIDALLRENAELRAAVGIARAAMVDALAFHRHVLSGRVKVQLNTAINAADSALAASEGES